MPPVKKRAAKKEPVVKIQRQRVWNIKADELNRMFAHFEQALHREEVLPSDAAERKAIPIGTGFFDYFSAAIAEVAKVSFEGNQQHNPGEPLHWARSKSTDQFDCVLRHLMDARAAKAAKKSQRKHLAAAAWRVLAMVQLVCEDEGAPMAPGASE